MAEFKDMEVCLSYKGKDKLKVIKYIELLYSKESPLNNIQNLGDRKVEACKQAKLNPHDTYVKEIMDLKNKDVFGLIFCYLSTFNNDNEFHLLMTDQQLLWSIQKILMTPVETEDEDELMDKYKKRAELSKTSDELSKRITRRLSEIYTQEDVREEATNFIRQMKTPEQRIKEKEENV
jgi:hypothetical protein